MKYILLLLVCSPAWACTSLKPGLQDKTLCRPANGKSYDVSFGKGLSMKASDLAAKLKMVNAEFRLLELSGGELSGDYRDLLGRGYISDITFTNADFRFADLTAFTFAEVKFEASRLQGTNFKGVDLTLVEFVDCDLKGAIFDLRTKLPFSVDEALEKGMMIK